MATDPLLLEPEALVEEDPREELEGGRATCTLQAILLGQSIRTALTPHLNKLISRPAGPPRLRANWGEASPQAIL